MLESVECIIPKIFKPCEGLHKQVYETAQEVVSQLRKEEQIPIFIGNYENTSGTICSQAGGHHGYLTPNTDKTRTDIMISEDLVWYPFTLFNVILHEILHSLGLDHNNGEPGLMSYAVTASSWFGSVVNDCKRLYLSVDDLKGLKESCKYFIK
jgi:hypothetical protein